MGILDLEDAVAPSKKEEARNIVFDGLGRGGYGNKTIVVRCNGLDTAWGRSDVHAVRSYMEAMALQPNPQCHPVSAIVLPKVENASQVLECLALYDACASSKT